jgi:glucosamine--fructose-6-phosphate aminotransferase (isomerizing)
MATYTRGGHIFEEITTQGESWRLIISQVTKEADRIKALFAGCDEVIFTGCGSALNVSKAAAAGFQMITGITARPVPAADIYLFPEICYDKKRKIVVVAISRSGRTNETVRAMQTLQKRGIKAVGVTCKMNVPLAMESDLAFVLSSVDEVAIATTRSVTGMMLSMQVMSGIVAANSAFLEELSRLPDLFAGLDEQFRQIGETIGGRDDLVKYAFVGNGPFYGGAHECELKLKELTLLPSDAYPMFDFRHGPKANTDSKMLVTVFISKTGYEEEVQFVRDMKALNGVTWALCDDATPDLRKATDYVTELRSGLSDSARGCLYMPAVQYMAYYRAMGLGLNPDEPNNLPYWVETSAPGR